MHPLDHRSHTRGGCYGLFSGVKLVKNKKLPNHISLLLAKLYVSLRPHIHIYE
jgi:hypothetical protein